MSNSTFETSHHSFRFVEAIIAEHRRVARDTWQLAIRSPELARLTKPGQFFMVRIAGCNDPLIGRALALFDTHRNRSGELDGISVVYVVKGKFTQALSRCVAGDGVEFWGPLGNGFSNSKTDHLIVVAGGVGVTPMLTLISAATGMESYGGSEKPARFADKVTFCYGARSRDYLVHLDQFQKRCADVRVATDDGSHGHHGTVTEVLRQVLSESSASRRIACCGPEPMMEAVSKLAKQFDTPCEVSLETPMACGIGICFTCVAKVIDGGGEWDYRRTCVEGPVFDASKVEW